MDEDFVPLLEEDDYERNDDVDDEHSGDDDSIDIVDGVEAGAQQEERAETGVETSLEEPDAEDNQRMAAEASLDLGNNDESSRNVAAEALLDLSKSEFGLHMS